ncbi:MAG: Asp-tRNA(Asn)/Glu-tRNA(Gln) amidotransferase subunit GatC [Fimbriimonadaceae bacterium]
MSISLDEVRHVAKLARLELNEDELVDFQGKLNALLGHFEDIQGLDVSNQAPKPHAVSMINVLAEDIIASWNPTRARDGEHRRQQSRTLHRPHDH